MREPEAVLVESDADVGDVPPLSSVCVGEGRAQPQQEPQVSPPLTTRELFRWPQRIAAALNEPAAVCRLHSLLLGKIVVASDYSGYASEHEALSTTLRALADLHGWHFEEHPFVYKRVCDIGKVPQHVLTTLSQTHFGGRMCVFSDVVQHCVPTAVDYLRASLPPEDCSQEEAEQAYTTILEWLLENRAWIFPVDGKQKCLVHKHGPCFVSPMAGWMMNAEALQNRKRKRATQHMSEEEDADAPASADGEANVASGSKDLPACGLTEADAEEQDSTLKAQRPLSISFAGVTCDGWSTMGCQKRFGHHSELPHAVWVAERKARSEQLLEDVAFMECTQNYPADVKLSPLKDTHMLLHFKCSPSSIGFPASRTRVFGACLNLQTVKWLGPGPSEWEADFRNKFYTQCVLGGDALFTAPSTERMQECVRMASGQKNFVKGHSLAKLEPSKLLEVILTPGQQQRVSKYLGQRSKYEGPAGRAVCFRL